MLPIKPVVNGCSGAAENALKKRLAAAREEMRKNLPRVLALAVLLLSGSTAAQERTRVLDLTHFVPSEGSPVLWGGGALAGSPHRPVRISRPLHLSLIEITPREGRPGEPLIYEARLRNVGSHSVKIPWDPDWKSVQGQRETPPSGYLAAWLSLFVDGAAQQRRLAEHVLYGSSEKPGSVLELAPGDEVRIRAPGSWPQLEGEEGSRGVQLQVRVQFSFLYGPADVNTEWRYISEPKKLVLNPPR